MTSSFQSTAFQSSASPVDTFVRPPSVQPKTDIESLAEALATVNPTLQKIIGTQLEKKRDEEIARGMQLRMEEGKKELPKVLREVNKKDGKDVARQLVGGNIFAQYGYEKRDAQLLALDTNRKAKSLYQNYRVTKTLPSGETVGIPISHYNIDSPEYQEFSQQLSSINQEYLPNIRSTLVADIYTPNFIKTLEDTNDTHLKENSEFKIERNNTQLKQNIFSNWSQFDSSKITKEQAIANIQEVIEENYNLGFTENVSGENLLEIVKDQAARIFSINREAKQGGYAEASKYLDLVKELKYGPKEIQKDGSAKQRVVGDLYGETMLNFEIGLIKKQNELNQLQKEEFEEKDKKRIEKLLLDNPNDIDLAEKILLENSDYREFIFDTIEIVATDRDELFNEFDRKVATQFYANDRTRMFADLELIKKQIGRSMTPEDEERYKLSWSRADARTSKGVNYDSKIQRTHLEGGKLIGKVDKEGNVYWDQGNVNLRDPYLRLKTFYDRRFLDEIYVPGLEGKDRETTFREIQNEYYKDLTELRDAEGEDLELAKDKFSDVFDKPKSEKEIQIQALVDDYGIPFETAEQIYNEEFIETEIKPTETAKTEDKEKELLPNTTFDSTEIINKIMEQNKNQETTTEKEEVEVEDDGPEKNFLKLIKDRLSSQEFNKIADIFSSPVVAGGLEGKPRSYTVKSGDTLEAIAKDSGIELDALITANKITDADFIKIGQQLVIPAPVPTFIDKYKDKPVPDFGGLGKLVISGESLGSGSYNAFNKGSTDTAGKMDITSKTISEMKQLQSEGKVSAVGAYQFTEGVLEEAREVSGIAEDAIMTPAVQDRLFWAMLTGGKKKPNLTDYLLGKSDDLRKAHEDLAKEFAALEGPDGKGIYDDDKAGNNATIKAAKVKAALIKARKQILKELK
mgnify:CR=1 FL=1